MKRTSVPALAAVAMLLVACPKKGDAVPDAAADAAVATAEPVPDAAAPVALPSDPTAVATLATATPAPAAKPASTTVKTSAVVDAGPEPQMCCCHVGPAYARISQSNCAGTMKGECVAKEECEKRSCCCDHKGKKTTEMMADCTKTKGKCVGKEQCQ